MLIHDQELSRENAVAVVNLYFNEIKSALQQDKKVKIPAFGSFEVKYTKPRIGRNPKTKEEVMISARRVVTWSQTKKLIERINNYVRDD